MHFRFDTKRLEELYYEEKRTEKYSVQVVQRFFEVMAIIAAAPDERNLYAFKSLHFKQLKGARGKRGERSIRLNREYRLIVAVERDQAGNCMLIIRIEKHYGD